MLEGTSDTGTHSRTVKIKSNVRDKEGARAVQAAVGTMDSGLPKAITFDDMDGSTLLDGQSATTGATNKRKQDKAPTTTEEWITKLGADARLALQAALKLKTKQPKHWETFSQALSADADNLRKAARDIEDKFIGGAEDIIINSMLDEARTQVKDTIDDLITAQRVLGEEKVEPKAKRQRVATADDK
jgi:hypothetical protein